MMDPLFGVDRRGLLRMAATGVVGSVLPSQLANHVATAADAGTVHPPGFGQARSVLLVLLSGGPSQLDMLDPKPECWVDKCSVISPPVSLPHG
ncbi:MAG: DUF1501 domain-containing protein [Pirellulaceae bacterium]|nr:DUF1501 domain-containing protein [Pirellulaceae bacterium]